MIKEITDKNFEEEVLKSEKLVLVDFWAPWCGPCKQLGPVIDEVAKEVGDSVKIFKMNVDESPETASKYGIRSIPTLMIFKEGATFSTKLGVHPKNVLIDWIKDHNK
ncbi:MAG: thioredoxin [Rickettsiales bacterium]|nr:thioredoxin [Rickettsiales bacterium]